MSGNKQITVERFSVVSAKPFAEVVRAIEAQVGIRNQAVYEPFMRQKTIMSCNEWSMTLSAQVI